MAAQIAIVDLSGKNVGQLTLQGASWSKPVRLGVIAQAVAAYRTNLRAGTASTKHRGEVSGGGKKPWKQKHTGRARAGSIRSPLWRGGGIVYGPKPRIIRQWPGQAIRRQALLESLKGKLRDEELVVLDALQADAPKTKPFAGLRKTFSIQRRALLVLASAPVALRRSVRNIRELELRSADSLNAYDVVNAHKVLVTREAFDKLQARLGDGSSR